MPVNPDPIDSAPRPVDTGAAAAVPAPAGPARPWSARLLNICFAIFAFEIGIFLVIFPWMDDVWKVNSFPSLFPGLRQIWEDPYFRGALTGLGLVNVYVGCWELLRTLLRPS